MQRSKVYEKNEQKKIMEYAKYRKELKWFFAIPNGGSRNLIEAVSLKAQGVKSGVPDMFLPLASCGYHGLFIELKVGENKVSENQKEFINDISKNGFLCVVCYGADETIEIIEKYLKGEICERKNQPS